MEFKYTAKWRGMLLDIQEGKRSKIISIVNAFRLKDSVAEAAKLVMYVLTTLCSETLAHVEHIQESMSLPPQAFLETRDTGSTLPHCHLQELLYTQVWDSGMPTHWTFYSLKGVLESTSYSSSYALPWALSSKKEIQSPQCTEVKQSTPHFLQIIKSKYTHAPSRKQSNTCM